MSLDILPELKELWPKKGDKLYIRLEVDKKDLSGEFLAYQEDFQRFGSSSLQQHAKSELACNRLSS